jgi:hypothetical protein
MRIPMIPVALLLVVAFLLYLAFHGSRRVLEATDDRPKLAFATANDLANPLKVGAVRYHQQLGRWPQTPSDVNQDAKWMSGHRGVESVGFGPDGAVRVHLRAASDGPATWLIWTPRERGDQVIWDCASDHAEIAKVLPGCVAADAATLAGSAPAAADREPDDPVEVPGLSARCQALGKVGHAAARARADGVLIDDFVRAPVVAFVDDASLRKELEEAARWVYRSAAEAPGASQRSVLTMYRCSPL